jgi:hypothetical protein
MIKKILDYLKSLEKKSLKILGGIAIVLIGAFGGIGYRIYVWWSLPAPIKYSDVLHLNNDVWTEAERQRYYHLSQGSQVIPYDWFVALEQGDNEKPFSADDNMTRFRFIPDSNTLSNPDRLPIGFARDDPDPITGVVNVGLTCATCHTAQMTYKGTGIRIDGAPGLIDFDNFLITALASLEITKDNSSKFERFARKVLKDNYNRASAAKLKADVGKYIIEHATEKAQEKVSDLQRGEKATKGGFGRIDALGAGGNRLYRQLSVKNLQTLNSPVKALPLWYTHEYNWVQTDGSIRQPMARNIIEALAVNASLVFPGDKTKNYADRYISSVRLNNMFEMESMIQRFKAPVWPEKVLGKIDPEAVKRGEVHYQKYCSSCHEPQKENQPEPGDQVAIKNNKTYFVLRLFPVDKLNTDPTDAVNFARRRLDASSIQMGKDIPGPEIIGMVLSGIIKRRYDELQLPLEKQEEWNGYRDNLLRPCEAYPARPLAGVWANAPYLHNGSVPSLYQLLLPPAERAPNFCTGDVEFDPVNIGYVNKAFCGFKFDTSIKGNSNAGHQYGTSLKHEERMDLIEYLKALTFPEKDYGLIAPQPNCP